MIIPLGLFEAAQKQLKVNRDKCVRNCKHEYLLRGQLKNPDFATKRDFIESMGIKVWLDGENIEITGAISPEDSAIAFTSSR